MQCPGCRRDLADNEPVYQVSVGYFCAAWRGRLVHGQNAHVGHVCAGCRDQIEMGWSQPRRLARSCGHCGRPVRNLTRLREPKYIACSRSCRVAVHNAQPSRWRKVPMAERTCACGTRFMPRRTDALYCSSAFKQRAYRARASAIATAS